MSVNDTIYALATPPGQSAIAIIRISGLNAHGVLIHFGISNLIVEDKPIAEYHRLKTADGLIVDDVMLVLFPSKSSPTGENITEIQCHGSPAVIQSILSHLAGIEGMRPAQQGEFSRRSFNNGKVGLIDLEGLSDLIEAQTLYQHQQAINIMTGKLSARLKLYRETLISLSSKLEAVIDFSDEELPEEIIGELSLNMHKLKNQILSLIEDSKYSEQIREGVKITLVGPVNAGKSTILNALAQREVAIVSSVAGTTRDVIEVKLDLGGISVIFNDTAGIRKTEDVIEIEGIERAKSVAESSDLTLLVLDLSGLDWEKTLSQLESWKLSKYLVLLNKADLLSEDEIEKKIKNCKSSLLRTSSPLVVSFHEKSGQELLIKRLTELLSFINVTNNDVRLTRSWHKTTCLAVCNALERAITLDSKEHPEIVAEELRLACNALGRLTGQVAVDDLLDNIFSSFCIGK